MTAFKCTCLFTSLQASAELQSTAFESPDAALEAVQAHISSFDFGFEVYRKKKGKQGGPPLFWIVCRCADKPPQKPSAMRPDIKPRAVKPSIKCDCKWRIVLQPRAVTVENSAGNGSSSSSSESVKWFLALPASFTDGHNHELGIHMNASTPVVVGGSRIISKAELTDEILDNVRTWSRVPTVRGKALQHIVLHHHFGGDLNAVFEPAALNKLNNIVADVTATLAFTKGDSKQFIAALNQLQAGGGYIAYDLTEDCTFRRAFWATQEQVERAVQFGLDVIMQVSDAMLNMTLQDTRCSVLCYRFKTCSCRSNGQGILGVSEKLLLALARHCFACFL
jgi:hypothetical protein